MSVDPYVTLDQIKDELGITDSTRDGVLMRKVGAASRWVDKWCGRRFIVASEATAETRVFDLALRVVDRQTVLVEDIGSVQDLVIETGTVAGGFAPVTGYDVTVGNALGEGRAIESIYNPTGWQYWSGQRAAWGGQQLRITARWGWPEIPEDVVEATMIQAVRLFKRKDSPEGVVGTADWGMIRVSRVDPDVRELLAPYVRMVVA